MAYQLTDEDRQIAQQMAMQRFGQLRPQQQTAQAPKTKNFLLDQISTVGGIIGSVGGGLLGAAAGGVGAVPGAAIGGAGGSALGETLENLLTGESIGKNVGKEAVLGGVFGAGPVKLAKAGLGIPAAIASRGGESVVASGIAKPLAKKAVQEGGEQALKTGFTGRLTRAGNKALASQYGTIGKAIARETKPLDTIGKLADIGIVKPVDAERIGRAITGSSGILTEQVAKAIGSAGKVSVDTIPTLVDDAIVKNGLSGLSKGEAISKMIRANIDSIEAGGNSPDVVMKAIRNLESHTNEMLGRGGTYHLATSTDKQMARVLREVTDELKNRLYNAAGANGSIKSVLTPELREQLISLHPKSPEWAKFVNQKVMKAKSIGELRNVQSPFVRIGKIIDEADINDMTFGGRVGNSYGGPGGITGRVADAAIGLTKNPTARFAGKNLRDIGTGEISNQSAKGIGGTALNLSAANMLARGASSSSPSLGTIGNTFVNGHQSVGPNIADTSNTTNATTMNPAMNANMPGLYPNGQDLSSTMGGIDQMGAQNPYSRENLLYDIQRDPVNAKEYIQYYQMLQEVFATPDPNADLSQSSRNALASSDNAINTIDQLESLFTSAGGGSGRLGGTIKGFAADAGLDEDAKVYNSLSEASVTQIAKALAGSGAGTVSDMDAKVIIAALPTLRDTPAEARAKFAALRQRLQAARDNTLLYGGGGGTLEGVLTGGSY